MNLCIVEDEVVCQRRALVNSSAIQLDMSIMVNLIKYRKIPLTFRCYYSPHMSISVGGAATAAAVELFLSAMLDMCKYYLKAFF